MISKFKIKNLKLKISAQQKGFTVLESIIAILVLSLSVSGVFSAVQQSLSQATIAKDEVKAFFLAQEAIEIIRNKRDTNQIIKIRDNFSNNWLSGIAYNTDDPCYFGKICRTDAFSGSFTYCGTSWGSCENLKQDTNTFLYNYISGNTTNFKREIQIEPVGYDELNNLVEIAVTVRISWTKGLIPMEFKVKTLLFNWI